MTAPETEHYVEPLDDAPLVPRREMDDTEMDITPMIDITFLLLIFFIVAAKLDEDAAVELPPARHGGAVAIKSSVIITVAQGESEQAEFYAGDGKAAETQISGDPESQEEALVAYIEEEIRAGKEQVLIKAESGVKRRDVARASAAVGRAGKDLFVAVLEVQ